MLSFRIRPKALQWSDIALQQPSQHTETMVPFFLFPGVISRFVGFLLNLVSFDDCSHIPYNVTTGGEPGATQAIDGATSQRYVRVGHLVLALDHSLEVAGRYVSEPECRAVDPRRNSRFSQLAQAREC